MKRKIVFVFMLLAAVFITPGCKKFLDTESPTRESGASFWKTRADVERFTNNLYGEMADILLNNSFFLAAEFRCGLYRQTRVYARDYFDWFPANNLRAIVYNNSYWNGFFHFDRLTDWNPYFKIIQSAGILIDRAPTVPDSEISPEEKKHYVAEGVFVRNFCYFLMVRLYGDVPYYTQPYFDKVIGRSDFVEVLNKCIAELDKYKNDLPWTYPDPRKRAVRPTVGTMYALMMHMNMWNAGFDDLNKGKYYEHTAALFKEFEAANKNTYRLLTTAEFTRLFRGGSEEGLFEFSQNVNYGELRGLGYQYLNDNVIRGGYDRPYLYLQKKFLEKMYPASDADKRRDIWFDANMLSESRGEFLKFSGNRGSGSGYDGSLIVFRLADMYLLASEANAELGGDRNGEAIRLLNVIRARAEAPAFTSAVTQRDLQDAIYWERTKELMGEGHYFYDLVRTKRILNSEYCAFPISQPAFQRGAWTWPITEDALTNNPLMRLNEYWR